jgi:hypothetical protein
LRRKGIWALVLAVVMLALCGAGEKKDVQTLIIIDADVQRLYLYKDQQLVKSYPCAVGKYSTPSPLGVWRVNGKAVGWGTGFGTRFLSLNCPWGKFGIHGTNKPGSIGGDTSHGCIRMLNKDVEDLYPQVPVGAKVIIERSSYGNMAAGLRTLMPGDRGSDVKEVQTRLKTLGYLYGNPDGVFGDGTKDALTRFKKDKGLPATNAVDWSVYKALGITLFE